jgi:uncharacterized protein YidB (DUF937 family)
MAPGFPSLTALLSLLVVAGLQNRDRLTELFTQTLTPPANDNAASSAVNLGQAHDETDELLDSVSQGTAGGLGGLFGGTAVGGALSGALGSLMEHFEQNGLGKTARSWVSSGANEPVGESELERALGEELMNELTERTGLPRQELLARLAQDLPRAVDELTPAGTLPGQEISSRQDFS